MDVLAALDVVARLRAAVGEGLFGLTRLAWAGVLGGQRGGPGRAHAGGLVGSVVGNGWVVLVVTGLVAWVLLAWLGKRSQRQGAVPPSGRIASGSAESLDLTMPDGTPIRNARGHASLGGTAADVAPQGQQMVWLDMTIEGDNIETLVELLSLSPGYTGYRDALLQPDGERLIVNAMARLTADVAASGDDDVNAAPIGYLPREAWSSHPELGRGLTLVQVAIMVNRDGSRGARIGFVSPDKA